MRRLDPAVALGDPEGMALAVCLLFDPRSERLVRELWDRLEAQGVRTLASHTHGRHHPHLSLAVLRSWDLVQVQASLAELDGAAPGPLSCQGTLVFPRGRVTLAASTDRDLVERQERVAVAVRTTGADLHRNYLPGRWVPHVSVATRAHGSALPIVVKTIADCLPLDLRVDRAALVDSSTGRTWPLPGIP